jgi:tetratricopeptide (TPR) repeat protein
MPSSPVLPANLSTSDAAIVTSRLGRRCFLVLAAIALAYAFLAGLHTLSEPDLGWQLATGRWVAQHHRILSTDVFSYTAYGGPWIYPVGSGLVFYAAYLLGGYALLSWIGAAACLGTVALLLRRGSAVSAAMAIVALPLIAVRTAPRAEVFTIVLFAAYLSILWQNYQTGRARLWLLPLLMIAWVNFHLGFVAGLALIVAFAGLELLEMLFPGTRRREAVERLRRAAPWFVASAAATLVNPWGWGIYRALSRQNRAMALHSGWIFEWGSVPLNRVAAARAFSLRGAHPFYLLLVIVAIAALVALLQRQPGAAILLLGAAYQGVRHLRLEALTGCVVVVVGGSILFSAMPQIGSRIHNARIRSILATSAVALFALLAFTGSAALVKINQESRSTFGTGLSWWFPQRAAEFIERQDLPGEMFNSYVQGGYLAWRLGPKRRVYIDSRAIPFGPEAFLHLSDLLQASPDSALWQQEAGRYNINTIILPLDRFQSELEVLRNFCNSTGWRPVYLDEAAGVFVRRKPETEDLIRRSQVECATVSLPAGPLLSSSAGRFNQWADAASVLAALGRNSEALAAADQARLIFPNSSFVPWLRGNVFYAMGLRSEAEREYVAAVSVEPNVPLFWFSLANLYKHEGRFSETIHAQRQAIQLSTMPQPLQLVKLAQLYLEMQQPRAALETFDEAVRSAPPDLLAATGGRSFKFQVDQGRAAACRSLGDMKRAASFDDEAVQDLLPRK